MINQTSTFDINMINNQEFGSDMINIAKSRMLEPNMNINNKQTIDKSSYRSFGGNQIESQIYTGGQ